MDPQDSFRHRLADRFGDFPFLRLLLLQPLFGLVCFLTLLLLAALGLGLPKLWVVSPPEFRPRVRISLVDYFQAKSLKRTGQRLAAQGKERDAALAWQSALANNPADPDLHRDALRQLLRSEPFDRRYIAQALSQTAWLLRLAHTNAVDVELASQVYDRYGVASELYALLWPMRDRLSSTQEGPFLKAAFLAGDMASFQEVWKRGQERFAADPELGLYHAAYLGGWGPVETAAAGRQRLEAATQDPARRELALRLQIAMCAKLMDATRYESVLRQLEEDGVDRLPDRIGYWTLLASTGRKAEARQLAATLVIPPRWPWEVMQLVGALLSLDMNAEAIELLRRLTPEFGRFGGPWGTAIWLAYSDLLIGTKQWDALLDLANRMRQYDRVSAEISGFIYFLDGRAHCGLAHRDLAEAAFKKAITRDFPSPSLALEVATVLQRLGYPGLARDLLQQLERDLAGDPKYWRAVLAVADALKQDSLLVLKAALSGRQLEPENPAWESEYGLALLVNRQSPAEAAQLTWKLLANNPDRVEAKVNHSLALAGLQRFDEADALLRTLDPAVLNDVGRSLYYFGAFEVHVHRQEFEKAKQDLARINPAHLFPPQNQWIEKLRTRLPAAGKAARS